MPFCLAGWVRRHPASVQEDPRKRIKLQSACDNKALDSVTYKDLSKPQLGSPALTAMRWCQGGEGLGDTSPLLRADLRLASRREGLARALPDQRHPPSSHRSQLLPQQTGSSGQTMGLIPDGRGEAIKRSPCPGPSTSLLRLQVLDEIHSWDHADPNDMDFSGHAGAR